MMYARVNAQNNVMLEVVMFEFGESILVHSDIIPEGNSLRGSINDMGFQLEDEDPAYFEGVRHYPVVRMSEED